MSSFPGCWSGRGLGGVGGRSGVETFGMQEEGKKLLAIIGSAFSSILLKATTNINLKDFDDWGKKFEEKDFMTDRLKRF